MYSMAVYNLLTDSAKTNRAQANSLLAAAQDKDNEATKLRDDAAYFIGLARQYESLSVVVQQQLKDIDRSA